MRRASSTRRPVTPATSSAGGTALHEPLVGGVDVGDAPPDDPLGQPAIALDLEQFGHGAER